MGASGSIESPLSEAQFMEVVCNWCYDKTEAAYIYNKLRNMNDEVSRGDLTNFLERSSDCFLTHDWGTDEKGRSNHARVSRMHKALQQKGIKCWFDEEQMKQDVVEQMIDGIDCATTVICFITKRYIDKVSGKSEKRDRDNCLIEFSHSVESKGKARIISVVMEDRCSNPNLWTGKIGLLKGNLYADYKADDDAKFEATVDDVYSKVMDIINASSGWKMTIQEKLEGMKVLARNEEEEESAGAEDEMRPPEETDIAPSVEKGAKNPLLEGWKIWLSEVGTVPDVAAIYAENLVKNNIANPARLAKWIGKKGKEFLLENPFKMDVFDVDDIVEKLGSLNLLPNSKALLEKSQPSPALLQVQASSVEAVELGVTELIKLLTTPGQSMEKRADAAAALMNLAENTDNKVLIAKEGGIAPLIALVKEGSPVGKEKAAEALWYLSRNTDNMVLIAKEGGILCYLAWNADILAQALTMSAARSTDCKSYIWIVLYSAFLYFFFVFPAAWVLEEIRFWPTHSIYPSECNNDFWGEGYVPPAFTDLVPEGTTLAVTTETSTTGATVVKNWWIDEMGWELYMVRPVGVNGGFEYGLCPFYVDDTTYCVDFSPIMTIGGPKNSYSSAKTVFTAMDVRGYDSASYTDFNIINDVPYTPGVDRDSMLTVFEEWIRVGVRAKDTYMFEATKTLWFPFGFLCLFSGFAYVMKGYYAHLQKRSPKVYVEVSSWGKWLKLCIFLSNLYAVPAAASMGLCFGLMAYLCYSTYLGFVRSDAALAYDRAVNWEAMFPYCDVIYVDNEYDSDPGMFYFCGIAYTIIAATCAVYSVIKCSTLKWPTVADLRPSIVAQSPDEGDADRIPESTTGGSKTST
jgi:hypothetical protein